MTTSKGYIITVRDIETGETFNTTWENDYKPSIEEIGDIKEVYAQELDTTEENIEIVSIVEA